MGNIWTSLFTSAQCLNRQKKDGVCVCTKNANKLIDLEHRVVLVYFTALNHEGAKTICEKDEMRLTGAISMNFQLRKMRVNIRSHILFFHLIHSFLDIFPIYILEKIRRTMVSSLLAVNRTQFLFHSRYRIYVRLSIGEKSHTN